MSSESMNMGSSSSSDSSNDLDTTISGVKRSLEIAISGSVSGSGAGLDVEEIDPETKSPPTNRPRQQLQIGSKGKPVTHAFTFHQCIDVCIE